MIDSNAIEKTDAEEGAWNKRPAVLRMRDGGIEDLVRLMGDGGLAWGVTPRITRLDGEILIDFLFNAGLNKKCISFCVDIPLTKEENDLKPASEKVDDEL